MKKILVRVFHDEFVDDGPDFFKIDTSQINNLKSLIEKAEEFKLADMVKVVFSRADWVGEFVDYDWSEVEEGIGDEEMRKFSSGTISLITIPISLKESESDYHYDCYRLHVCEDGRFYVSAYFKNASTRFETSPTSLADIEKTMEA